VFERSDGDRPNEVYAAGQDFSNPHVLTNLNPQLAGVALSHSELVSYLDADGKKLYGVLYYPANYQPGKKYPLVAEIYESFFDNGFNENMNLLAGRGWFVFHPSVDFEIGYPGEAWVKGVTDGINSLQEKGLVDGTKLGVEGTSYGGYATNLLITQTNRFAAAVTFQARSTSSRSSATARRSARATTTLQRRGRTASAPRCGKRRSSTSSTRR
jgi:dipeptidyl aminopeptidase/acylaminoacyl peptidase